MPQVLKIAPGVTISSLEWCVWMSLSTFHAFVASHIESYTSHMTRHTSHFTRHTSHITHHKGGLTNDAAAAQVIMRFFVTHHTSHITHHTSHFRPPNAFRFRRTSSRERRRRSSPCCQVVLNHQQTTLYNQPLNQNEKLHQIWDCSSITLACT